MEGKARKRQGTDKEKAMKSEDKAKKNQEMLRK